VEQTREDGSGKLTWDRTECAKPIGVTVRTLDRMVAEGRIPVLKVRAKKLFLPDAIREWLPSLVN